MKAKEIVILALIILAGVSLHYLENCRFRFDDWEEDFLFRGQSYTFSEHLSLEAAEILEITNSHGQIQVEGNPVEQISLILEKKVWSRHEEKAREKAEQIKVLVSRENNRLILTTNRHSFKKKNFTTDFRLSVPKSTVVKVRNSFGLVRVIKVKEVDLENRQGRVEVLEVVGPVRVVNSHQNLTLTDIGGPCQVETRHASALLSRIRGPVRIDCAHQNLELFDLRNSLTVASRHTRIKAVRIAGPSEIQGTYELITVKEAGSLTVKGHHSPLEIDSVNGDLKLETTYEPVRLENLSGNVLVVARHSSVIANQIKAGELKIQTSYQPVKIIGFSGQLEVQLKHGNITLIPENLNHPISVQVEYGDLRFFWPSGQKAGVEAMSKGGRIFWHLPFPPDESRTDGLSILRAFSSENEIPSIKLRADYGNITIQEKE